MYAAPWGIRPRSYSRRRAKRAGRLDDGDNPDAPDHQGPLRRVFAAHHGGQRVPP